MRARVAIAGLILSAVLVLPGFAQTTQGNQSPAVKAGRDATINYGLTQPKEIAAELLRQMIASGVLPAAPGVEQRVSGAITDIARGAQAGDEQLQKALGLLKAGDVKQAAEILRAVANEKTARIKRDSKDAAIAYRNLGAIAGLADPKQALEAYNKALELDPDDVESLLWAGLLEKERGDLDGPSDTPPCAAAGEGGWRRPSLGKAGAWRHPL